MEIPGIKLELREVKDAVERLAECAERLESAMAPISECLADLITTRCNRQEVIEERRGSVHVEGEFETEREIYEAAESIPPPHANGAQLKRIRTSFKKQVEQQGGSLAKQLTEEEHYEINVSFLIKCWPNAY